MSPSRALPIHTPYLRRPDLVNEWDRRSAVPSKDPRALAALAAAPEALAAGRHLAGPVVASVVRVAEAGELGYPAVAEAVRAEQEKKNAVLRTEAVAVDVAQVSVGLRSPAQGLFDIPQAKRC